MTFVMTAAPLEGRIRMRRIMVDDLKINNMDLYVEGVLKLHNSDGLGNFTLLGEASVVKPLSGNAPCLTIRRLPGRQSIPEITDEEYDMIHSMMDAYIAAIMHRKSFFVWVKGVK